MNGLALCAGVGGLELGLRLAIGVDYRTVCYVEREAFSAATIVARMEDEALDRAPIWDDLTSFSGEAWRGSVDIITAGYPCQPFSVAGKQRAEADPRHLWPHVARIIREVEPEWVFLENVANHFRLGFNTVARELREMGYDVAAGVYSAAEVGAPHRRDRLFALAHASEFGQREPQHQTSAKSRGNSWQDTGGGGYELPTWPPSPSDEAGWKFILDHFPSLEPAVCKVPHGLAGRDDRLRAAGNGVVPMVAAVAFLSLMADLKEATQ